MKRIAVFGGRAFPDQALVWASLDKVLAKHGPFVLVHGHCPGGADHWADKWGHEQEGVLVERHPALWSLHGNAAGPFRNVQMVNSGLDGAVGFPGGAGTRSMKRLCWAAGVKVWFPNDR